MKFRSWLSIEVQLLVNPNNKHVAIKAVDKPTPGDQTERIKPQEIMVNDSYELYSTFAFGMSKCTVCCTFSAFTV